MKRTVIFSIIMLIFNTVNFAAPQSQEIVENTFLSPVDGGLGVLILAGVVYGAKIINQRHKRNEI